MAQLGQVRVALAPIDGFGADGTRTVVLKLLAFATASIHHFTQSDRTKDKLSFALMDRKD